MNGKIIGLVIFLVLLLIFVIQNTQAVAIKFLFWEWSTSLAVLVLLTFGIGFLLGRVSFILRPKNKKRAGDATVPPAPQMGKP